MKNFKVIIFSSLMASQLFWTTSAICQEPPLAFCQKNPNSRICKSAIDEAKDKREELEAECSLKPNTEKCKAKRTREKVRAERLDFCEANPKKCAARQLRR